MTTIALDGIIGWFRIPMRGYEIPLDDPAGAVDEFRIPMRGYERVGSIAPCRRIVVPNPHEGL